MTAVLWSRTDPYQCSCSVPYQPVLRDGRLVRAHDPAWRMLEQTRDPGCLQEQFRTLTKLYQSDYQHHKTSKGSGSGYPDCHCWAPGRGSLYAELKRMGKNPTPEQISTMAGLQDAATTNLVYLVRPCCLLTGAVDEMLADFTGRRCLYAGGRPTGKPTVDGVLADMAATDPRRPARRPVLPGADPQPFEPAVGVIVPLPASTAAAAGELEAWLRTCGLSPVDVPYPMRLIIGKDVMHAHCRVGLARAGHDDRVWRQGTLAHPFPDHLIEALHADQICGPSSEKVAWLIEMAPPSTQLPQGGGEEQKRC